jgi:predicted N-formylglutamate amidohydrolase
LRIENAMANGPVLVICDHAGKEVPDRLGDLGVGDAALSRHIGWDIGAASVARNLSRRLSATALFGVYSRLVLDLNRHPADPTLIAETSDGCVIPANRGLSEAARRMRIGEVFRPYHAAISARLDWSVRSGADPILIGIHSFTPAMNGRTRPWQVGVLWNRDGRIAVPLMQRLADDGVLVGDNEPYSGRLFNYTLNRHGQGRGIRHVSIEVRQDLIASPDGALAWADRLHAALRPLLT